MTGRLVHLHRFPVKGLQAEPLTAAELVAQDGLAGDRRFAVARGDTRASQDAAGWLPKQWFVMLMRDTALARVRCHVDGTTMTLALDGRPPCTAPTDTAAGRAALDDWLNDVLGPRPEGRARVIEAGPVSFTDVPQNCLSLVNLESVRDLARRMDVEIDPLRFRANLLVDGLPAWQEFDWIGSEIRLGPTTLHVPARIPRCNATAVNPATGQRDVNVVRGLRAAYGHYDVGVYAEVVHGGRIAVGDAVEPPDAPRSRSWVGHWLRFFGFLARGARNALRRG